MYYLTSLTSVPGGPLFFLGTAEVMRQTFTGRKPQPAATAVEALLSPLHTHSALEAGYCCY